VGVDLPDSILIALRRRGPGLVRRKRALCRQLFVARVAALAAVYDASVTLDVAPDVNIAPDVHLEVWPHTQTTVRLGAGVMIGPGVFLSLRGGRMDVGAGSELRRLAGIDIEGQLVLGERVAISTGATIHCKEAVQVETMTIVGEYSTIIDSVHLRTPPGIPIQHQVESRPVVIGSNCWLGAGCVVTRGVTIGAQAIVGAGSVVTKDVPAGWLALGTPASPVRQLSPVDLAADWPGQVSGP
jgi:acetyltransferase-like isoleucine patch superfamily enzyme